MAFPYARTWGGVVFMGWEGVWGLLVVVLVSSFFWGPSYDGRP